MATLRQVVQQLRRDDVFGLAAELAYRFFLAIFPFFLFLTALGQLLARGLPVPNPAPHFAQLLGQIMPPEAGALFQAELEYVLGTYHPGLASLGFASAMWLATGGTTALIK